MTPDLKFLNAFNAIPGVGAATLRALKNHFGAFEHAWRAGEADLSSCGITSQSLQAILWKRPSLHPDKEMEKLIREDVWLITEEDPHYPSALHEIPHAPLALYGRGRIDFLQEKENNTRLAVVGTRRPTAYGLETTTHLVHQLASAGCTIVSGLATGIDARAHEAALDARAHTIAVLGSGIDQHTIFPPENRGLARRITETEGIVISEYAPGTPGIREHFPQRNRIISGISRGVLVMEARERSGALTTARFALEQNREVFAVPGSIFSSTSRGPHALIQEGAKLIQNIEDVLRELDIRYTYVENEASNAHLEKDEQSILVALEEPLTIDLIKEKTGLATSSIIASLSLLELKGRVRIIGPDTYQKT